MYINKCAYLRSEFLPESGGGHMCDKELEKKGWEEEEIFKGKEGERRGMICDMKAEGGVGTRPWASEREQKAPWKSKKRGWSNTKHNDTST